MPRFSFEVVKERIMRRLGYPVVQVEALDEHIQEAIQQALDAYNPCFPLVKGVKAFCNGQMGIEIEDVVRKEYPDREILGIVDVLMPRGMRGMIPSSRMILPYTVAKGDVVMRTLKTTMREMLMRTVGQEYTWEFLRDEGRIIVDPPYTGECYVKVALERKVDEVLPEHRQWFLEYAECCFKVILGKIRGKYEGFSTPFGDISGDADRIISEAETRMDALREKLRTWAMHYNMLPKFVG